MPLGLTPELSAPATQDIPTRLKQLEQEIVALEAAVKQGTASPAELDQKKKEYAELRQKMEQSAGVQQALQKQAMQMGMNQLTQGQGGVNLMGGGQPMSGGQPGTPNTPGMAAMGAVGGGLAGLAAGDYNYRNDPNMTNKKDNFGTKYPDARAHVGGAILGATMGYFGGPAGAALAGPAVIAAHKVAEPTTRALINFGESWGGPGGSLMMDPIGTVSSGKYSIGELARGFLLGPFSKLIK